MKNNEHKTISVRVSLDEFAKARDGLIAKGVPEARLMSTSNIMKAAILMACLLNEEPKSPASQESSDLIKQFWKLSKRDKSINIDNLY